MNALIAGWVFCFTGYGATSNETQTVQAEEIEEGLVENEEQI